MSHDWQELVNLSDVTDCWCRKCGVVRTSCYFASVYYVPGKGKNHQEPPCLGSFEDGKEAGAEELRNSLRGEGGHGF